MQEFSKNLFCLSIEIPSKLAISFYPGDREVSRNYSEMETVRREIEDADFHLETEYTGMIIHEDVIQKGHVLESRKEK